MKKPMTRWLAILLFVLAGPCLAANWAGWTELENPAAIKVLDAKIVTRQMERGMLVTVLGNLKNEGAQSVTGLTLEAKLLDAQGQLVDVLTTGDLYHITVMPGDQIAFRLQGAGAALPASYAQVQVRVTGGWQQKQEKFVRSEAPGAGAILLWMAVSRIPSWVTMLLLLVVLVWFISHWRSVWVISRLKREKSLQAEQITLIQRQVAVLEKLARIAPDKDAPPVSTKQ